MKPIILFLFLINIIIPVLCVELKSLQYLFQLITGSDLVDSKKKVIILPNGQSNLKEFLFFTNVCYYESGNYVEIKKSKVKCIPANGNGSLYLLNGLNDVMNLLTPTVKETTSPGNCVILLFYTRACASCTYAPHYNALSRHFTDMKVAALDAIKNSGLNTEFGIIGLPTIILFHQGRIIQKFNNTLPITLSNLVNFITKNTNLKPISSNVVVTSEDFFNNSLRYSQQNVTDYYLYLSWSFIVICSIYYFTKSKICKQIVEVLYRNWRESQRN
ncbi:unnamed protein product [Diamesa serratosioi]